MRYAFIILAILISTNVKASAFGDNPRHCAAMLDKALLEKDTVVLNRLLDDQLEYGHSNGWIETKRNVIDDLYNGKLVYQKINAGVIRQVRHWKAVILRSEAEVEVLVSNVSVKLKLAILQVWMVKHFHWVLIARQSVKI